MDLNDQARVCLTKSGADIINKKNKSMNEILSHAGITWKDDYKKGDVLPSMEFLHEVYHAAFRTIRNAYLQLQEEGLRQSRWKRTHMPGKGHLTAYGWKIHRAWLQAVGKR